MPNAVPRSRPWKACAMSASEVANMMAPPTPWTARNRLSINDVVDSPHASEARVKPTSPIAKTSRRP
jgi:hypothetical protein